MRSTFRNSSTLWQDRKAMPAATEEAHPDSMLAAAVAAAQNLRFFRRPFKPLAAAYAARWRTHISRPDHILAKNELGVFFPGSLFRGNTRSCYAVYGCFVSADHLTGIFCLDIHKTEMVRERLCFF
jgi:hypothetical protein